MIYTPEELVRIELLRYPVLAEHLHPIEYNWRSLAKKLLEHAERLQELCLRHHESSHWRYGKNDDCPVCKENRLIIGTIFPKAFKAPDVHDQNIKIK